MNNKQTTPASSSLEEKPQSNLLFGKKFISFGVVFLFITGCLIYFFSPPGFEKTLSGKPVSGHHEKADSLEAARLKADSLLLNNSRK